MTIYSAFGLAAVLCAVSILIAYSGGSMDGMLIVTPGATF